jgi:hypothetical protein
MGARGPRPERTPENDIRVIANYCQRLDRILARLTTAEIEAMSAEDKWFLASFAGRTGDALCDAHDTAVGKRGESFISRTSIVD